MADILIKNGRVWDGEKFFLSDVLTHGTKIVKIESNISDNAEFIYDAQNKIVSAGLVDIHMHIRGISPDEWGVSPEMACIPFGVTAAADASSVNGDERSLRSAMTKLRAFVGKNIDSKRYGACAVGVKTSVDRGTGCTDAAPLRETVAEAEAMGGKITVHTSNSPVPMSELVSILRRGDILTHAYHGGANNASDDGYECIRQAKKKGVVVDAGMAGHIHTDFAVMKNAIACGAEPDVISTDVTRYSSYKRGGRYGMTMCMSIARDLGMSEENIMRAVTSSAARALGIESECGTLAVDRAADIAVLEYAYEPYDLTDAAGNRVHNDMGYKCTLTVVDGEIVYRA